ncbi:DNA-binding transcriptional LysR family regulator [Rhizobium sp. BK313]|nr:LysR substrate-binding domain-containing protein [Rhizobium sp. BK313]MBB3455204.1 DNA-binding transcriptional LysR family regulator [Rhizobium sp. BK313]
MVAFPPMRFDLTDLRLFLLVVEAGSITHGAMRANLALPSASERLRGMEEVSGVRLLERRRRGIAPTAAGDALAHHARIILRQIDHMQGELGGYAKGLKGNIRLLANTAAITEFLPEALALYLASRPHIDIDLTERLSTEIVKAVAGGLAEIGIISDAVDAGNLQLLPFAVDRLVVVMPPDHPLAAAKALAFAEIVRQEFVGLTIGSPLQEHIDEHAARAGHPLKFRVRMRTFEGICRMVAQGVGIGIVPETAAKRCRRSMAIRPIPLVDDWATRHLSLCMRAIEELSPFARDLVEHLSAGTKGSPGSSLKSQGYSAAAATRKPPTSR